MRNLQKDLLQIRIFDNRVDLGADAAKEVAAKINSLLKKKPHVNMIFAAAPSQDEFLLALCREQVPWELVNAFHMDEYIGLPAGATQRFGHFLKKRIFSRVPFRNVYYINGEVPDHSTECERYALLLTEHLPDVVCMGIGENTHIAFNDPGVADFADKQMVKVVALDEASRRQQVNEGCFDGIANVPTHAFTLTISALMQAPFIYCMVPGASKARAIYHTLLEEIQPKYPSTILRQHAGSILFLDTQSSARALTEIDP